MYVPLTTANIANINEIYAFTNFKGSVKCMAFSPDAAFLAMGDGSSNVKIWQLSDNTLKATIQLPWPGAEGIVYHPDGHTIITISGNAPHFIIWDSNTLTNLKEVTMPLGYQPMSIAITTSGKTIATGGMEGKIIIWDWNNRNPVKRSEFFAYSGAPGNFPMAQTLEFSQDGMYLATGCDNGEFNVWSMGFDQQVNLHRGLSGIGVVISVSFNSLATMAAAVSWGGFLELQSLYGATSPVKLNQLPVATDEQLFTCSFNPGSELLATAQSSSQVAGSVLQFWDAGNRSLLFKKTYLCDKVKFSPDGKRLAVIRNVPGYADIPTIWGIDIKKPPRH